MALRRFYVSDLTPGQSVQLNRAEADHARKALRLSAGDRVELFDGRGTLAVGVIDSLERELTIGIERLRQVDPITPQLDLAVAPPKGNRADDLVENLSQLGVTRLILLRTERSVVDPRPTKVERLGRIAVEAAKQSGRAHLLQLEPIADFERVIADADHDVKLMADAPDLSLRAEAGDRVQNLQDAQRQGMLDTRLKGARRVLVLIGPEGGWTDRERAAAREAGFDAWRLGPLVMRIETAAAAAAAIVRSKGSQS